MNYETKCKNCGKEFGDHRSKDLSCPKSKKGELHSFNPMKTFFPKDEK